MKFSFTRTRFADLFVDICQRKLAAICLVSLASQSVLAEDLPAKLDAILQREAQGEVVDRTAVAQDESRDNNLTKWHAGKVFVGNRWSNVDELNIENLPKRISRYLEQRDKTTLNVEGHRALARWCSQEKLEMQEKAHWAAVCDLSPNDAEARQKLGHRLIGGRWISQEQWNAADKQMQDRLANYRKWLPRIKSIASAVQGTDINAKSKALDSLRQIQDESAVQSLAVAAILVDGDQARPFVAAIRRFHSEDACLALTRIAIDDPASVASKEAVAGLKEYRPEFYVRNLLGLVEEDVEFSSRISARPTGELVLEQLWARDTSNAKTVLAIDTVLQAAEKNISADPGPWGNLRARNQFETRRLGRTILQMDIKDSVSGIAKSVSEQTVEGNLARNKEIVALENARHQEDRQRVFSVLKSCLGVDNGSSAKDWWAWWDSENDSNHIEARTQSYQYIRDENYAVQPVSVAVTRTHECLIAGTLIQIQSGLKPIESIRVGDMVLSQNVETAAMELKPVLKTTLRDPAPIMEIKTSKDSIQATRGHFWWVSGQGWRRTRELEPGWVVHTATGSVRIESVEPMPKPEATYNMIVADNHSYFVGESRLLSNDATELEPSLLAIPSFSKSNNSTASVTTASVKKDSKR